MKKRDTNNDKELEILKRRVNDTDDFVKQLIVDTNELSKSIPTILWDQLVKFDDNNCKEENSTEE